MNEYEVYPDGRVWNITRRRFIAQAVGSSGYMVCTLNSKSKNVHRIIAQCFVPNPDNKPEVNHIDGDKLNNHKDNLEWVTRSENSIHACRTGLQPTGSSSHMSKLKEIDLDVIRDMITKGFRGVDIAKEFGVSRHLISKIKHNKCWRHYDSNNNTN